MSNGNGHKSNGNGKPKRKRRTAKQIKADALQAKADKGQIITGADLPDFTQSENPTRREMVQTEEFLRDTDPFVLYKIDPRLREGLVRRIYGLGLNKEEKSPRVVLRAGQVAAMFDRVNLQYRMAGFGDFAGGKEDPRDKDTVETDREFVNFARGQAFQYANGMDSTNSLAVQSATPLTLATFASGGDWKPARHLLYLDDRIMRMLHAAENGLPGPRILLVDAPPRHGKSEYCSHWLPTWFAGKFPDRRVMLATYSGDFSKHWGRLVRDEITKIGRKYFEVGLNPDSHAAGEWGIAGRSGGMLSAGIGGMFSGKGANLLLVDDPVKNAEEAISDTKREALWKWWQSTAFTRLEPNGIVVIIMTRWHNDDLAGRLENSPQAAEIGVERVSMPAYAEEDDCLGRDVGAPLWPERMNRKELEIRRSMLDAYWWRSLYMGNPGSYGNAEWPEEYFDGIWLEDGETWPDAFEGCVSFLDPSKGKNTKRGDYSAIVFAGLTQGKIWIAADLARRPVPRICSDAIAFHARYPSDRFGVETNTFQELMIGPLDEAAKDAGVPPLPIAEVNNQTNKVMRISRLGPWLARHKFKIAPSKGAKILVQQLRDFPFGSHDDGPDALEGALRLLRWLLGDHDDQLDPDVPEEVRRV